VINIITRREFLVSLAGLGGLERRLRPVAFSREATDRRYTPISDEEISRREEEIRQFARDPQRVIYDHDRSKAMSAFADVHTNPDGLTPQLLEQFLHAAICDCDPSVLRHFKRGFENYANPGFGIENRKEVISNLWGFSEWREIFSNYLKRSGQDKIRALDELAAVTIQTGGFGIEGNSITYVFGSAFEEYQAMVKYRKSPEENVSIRILYVPYSKKRLEGLKRHEEDHRKVFANGIPYANSMITRLNYLNFHPNLINLVIELRGLIPEVEVTRPASGSLRNSKLEDLPQEYVGAVVRLANELKRYSQLIPQLFSQEEKRLMLTHLSLVEKKVPELLLFESARAFYNSWKNFQTSSL